MDSHQLILNPRSRPISSRCMQVLVPRRRQFFALCAVFLIVTVIILYRSSSHMNVKKVSYIGIAKEDTLIQPDEPSSPRSPSDKMEVELLSAARSAIAPTEDEADTVSEWEKFAQETEVDHSNDAYLVYTAGCRIPYIEAINDEVKQFVYDYETIICDDPPPLVESNDTSVYIVHSVIPEYNTSAEELVCCYRKMYRKHTDIVVPDWTEDEGSGDGTGPLFDEIEYGNDIRYAKKCVKFKDSADVPYEFVHVECTAGSTMVYRDVHAFIPPKRPRDYCGNQTAPDENSLNVLVVGIDAVSRLNFERTMPLTRKYLNSTMGAIDLVGYNKVEDNTFPNLVPMLSGFNISELGHTCWPAPNAHFDACPWIWKEFNQHGYVTSFVEDTAWMGLFHYLKKGFIQQPTDYDPRPLMYIGEKELGRKKGLNANFCIAQRHQISVLFDYARKYIQANKRHNQKMFGLFWGTSLSHDYLNEPGQADAMYEQFLIDLSQMGVLNNTALIFMSDHGLRYGPILSTYQGHLEERLPIMSLVLPDWFKKRYPKALENLNINQRRLMTVYDVHVTFRDFMSLRRLEDTNVERRALEMERKFESGNAPRGMSLFLPIPPQRTCADAGIPMHYCACLDMKRVVKDDPMVMKVATFLADRVNSLLSNYSQCARLSVFDIHDVWRNEPTANATAENKERVYQIKVHTQPGNALLSATVRHFISSGDMKLAGSVSRLNIYGSQSWCMPDFKLRLYCYCMSSTPRPDTTPLSVGGPF